MSSTRRHINDETSKHETRRDIGLRIAKPLSWAAKITISLRNMPPREACFTA
jgi:hypothetical protein